MNTHTNDNSSAAELDKCITWQYDKATNLVAFVGMLGDFFAQATQGLWDSWKNKVCDIDTADDFGLSVWGKILNCRRPMISIDGEDVNLGTEKYRAILKARAQLLASHGTVEDYKQYIQTAFNGHFIVIDDNGMGIRFEATGDATDEELALEEQFPDIAFLYPCGVRDSNKIEDGEFSVVEDEDTPALDNAYLNGDIKPLRFTSEQGGSTVLLKKMSGAPTVFLEHSVNGGSWSDYTYNTSITLNKDEYVEFRAKTTNTTFTSEDGLLGHSFITTGLIAASGNVMSLLSKDGSVGLNAPYCLACIFSDWIDTSVGLTEPPELPAAELGEYCYEYMFAGSRNLRHVPKLPATHIPCGAYGFMFERCTLITETPNLTHITSAGKEAFQYMFSGCTSLKDVRFVPLDMAEEKIYEGMFRNCVAIEKLPFDTFPAETLSVGCYASMFEGCTNLKGKFKILGTELVQGYVDEGGYIHYGCFSHMFRNCHLIDRIEVNFTEWKGGDETTSATVSWLYGVAATGEFICPPGLPISFGSSRIRTGWRVAGGNIHNVTLDYYDGDQRIVEVQQVIDGEDATVPEHYYKDNNYFVKWSSPLTNITSDINITAVYESFENKITAIEISNGTYHAGAIGLFKVGNYTEQINLEYLRFDFVDGVRKQLSDWDDFVMDQNYSTETSMILLRAKRGYVNNFTGWNDSYCEFRSVWPAGSGHTDVLDFVGNCVSLFDGVNDADHLKIPSVYAPTKVFKKAIGTAPDIIAERIESTIGMNSAMMNAFAGTAVRHPGKIRCKHIGGYGLYGLYSSSNVKISTSGSSGKEFIIEADELDEYALDRMFSETGGDFTGTPEPYKTYYDVQSPG